MRLTKEKELRLAYFNNNRKYKQIFLWFPLTIDGETRWLEEAQIVYRVRKKYDVWNNPYFYWEAWQFVNK